MLWLIQFLQKRPSDRTILVGRILFWILYIWIMYYNLIYLNKWIDNIYFFGKLELSIEQTEVLKYIFTGVWIIPAIMGVTNLCLLKKKYVRIGQIIFWFLIFYIATSIQWDSDFDFDILIWVMGVLPLFAGITGKCITSKCLRYKEKITKIRV